MDIPKISVLIPMYNRKRYIAQAIDSVLNQTFQDYEIIVRDDGSTDGSADFVAERYAAELSSGKLKLRRNEKNIGEFPTDNRLLREATGKYIMILHSDDLYMPYALAYMYTIAEKFNADVVHESVYIIRKVSDNENIPFKLKHHDRNRVDEVTVMTNDPLKRFNMWLSDIGIDAPHNIFNRQFLIDNDLYFEPFGGNRLLALKWLMRAKILVKSPKPFYVYRRSPDSKTREKFPPERVAKFISNQIELSRHLDKFFASDDFFKDKPEMQRRARHHILAVFNAYQIRRKAVYKNGISPELNEAVENVFKKYFGDDAFYMAFLFHRYNTFEYKFLIEHKKLLSETITPPTHTHTQQIDS